MLTRKWTTRIIGTGLCLVAIGFLTPTVADAAPHRGGGKSAYHGGHRGGGPSARHGGQHGRRHHGVHQRKHHGSRHGFSLQFGPHGGNHSSVWWGWGHRRDHGRHRVHHRRHGHGSRHGGLKVVVSSGGHHGHGLVHHKRWVPGCYTYRIKDVCVRPGYYEKRSVRVWVPGHWEVVGQHDGSHDPQVSIGAHVEF